MIKLVTAALLISSCSISTIDANRIIRSNVISVVPKSSSSSLLTTTSTTHKKETVTNNVNSNVVVSSRGGGDDISKSSLSTAIFNLVKGIVGVGVLSLPAGTYVLYTFCLLLLLVVIFLFYFSNNNNNNHLLNHILTHTHAFLTHHCLLRMIPHLSPLYIKQ